MGATSTSSSPMACPDETGKYGQHLGGGRPEPESIKTIDTYTYNEILPIVTMYVPGCIMIVHMRDGSVIIPHCK